MRIHELNIKVQVWENEVEYLLNNSLERVLKNPKDALMSGELREITPLASRIWYAASNAAFKVWTELAKESKENVQKMDNKETT